MCECIVDLEGVHDQMGEDWESIATYGMASTAPGPPSKKAAGRSLMKAFGVSAIPEAELAAAGRANPEIAQELYVTRKTVEHHLASIYRKLDLESREGLAGALTAEQ